MFCSNFQTLYIPTDILGCLFVGTVDKKDRVVAWYVAPSEDWVKLDPDGPQPRVHGHRQDQDLDVLKTSTDAWLNCILCLKDRKLWLNLIIFWWDCHVWIGFSIYPLIIWRCLSQIKEFWPWLRRRDQFIICPTSSLWQHCTASHPEQMTFRFLRRIFFPRSFNGKKKLIAHQTWQEQHEAKGRVHLFMASL